MGFSGWNDGVLESRYVGTIQSMRLLISKSTSLCIASSLMGLRA